MTHFRGEDCELVWRDEPGGDLDDFNPLAGVGELYEAAADAAHPEPYDSRTGRVEIASFGLEKEGVRRW